jgi:hypothetical protein
MSKEYITLGSLFISKDKDNKGRSGYYIKLDKDVEITVNGKKLTRDTISAKNLVTKFEEMIDRAGDKGDEEKVEKLEATKTRFEKGGDLDYIKQEFTVVIGD